MKKATAWQANGDGGWQTIGNDAPMTIPVNGYLAVYLSNATSFAQCEGCLNSEGDVYFDKLKLKFTRGNLKEETHYYPFGLPMAGIGSNALGMTPNRQKYQSNEYITDAGLNWMSFGARQYDPQLGRFLSVDPMASVGGQDMLSPYHAMENNPVSMTDPGGMRPGGPGELKEPNILQLGPPGAAIVLTANAPIIPVNNDMGSLIDALNNMAMACQFQEWVAKRNAIAALNKTLGGDDQQTNSKTPTNMTGNDGQNNAGDKGNGDENGYSKDGSLYTTPNGEKTHSVKEWAEHYDGKTWNEITTDRKGKDGDGYQRYFGGLIKFRLGPVRSWRYVKLPDGRILDMRHVLVVGMTSEFLGATGEYVQYLSDRHSANSVQDFVSNAAGAQFLNYLQQNSIYYDPHHSNQSFGNSHETNISQYFYQFIFGL